MHVITFAKDAVCHSLSLSLSLSFVVWRTAPLHLDDYLRLICFLSTSVYSALGVSAIMRYINRRLLTYLLTYKHASTRRPPARSPVDSTDNNTLRR